MAELKSNADELKAVIECLTVYMGDYEPTQQYAASILLKTILKEKKYKALMDAVKEELGFKINNRSDKAVLKWARNIKKKGACELCGEKEHLVAHHVIPWEYSVKGRTDISNGQCLCTECHKMVHSDIKWLEYKRRCKNE